MDIFTAGLKWALIPFGPLVHLLMLLGTVQLLIYVRAVIGAGKPPLPIFDDFAEAKKL